jgi:hypothetical protein
MRERNVQPHDLVIPNGQGKPDGHFLRKLKAIAKNTGAEGAELHRFRKTFADTLHEEGVSVDTIRIRLGHESLDRHTLRKTAVCPPLHCSHPGVLVLVMLHSTTWMRVVPTPCGTGFQEVAGSCVSVPEFSGPTNVNPKAPNKSTSPPPELIGSAQVPVRILFHLLGQGHPRACY